MFRKYSWKINYNLVIFHKYYHIRNISLKGLFTNFEYITFFSYPTKRNIFCKRSISIRPLWLDIIEEKRVHKVNPTEYYYIYCIYNTDCHWAPFFSIISSQELFYRDEPFIKSVSFVGTRKKFYIFKMNNPFKLLYNHTFSHNT